MIGFFFFFFDQWLSVFKKRRGGGRECERAKNWESERNKKVYGRFCIYVVEAEKKEGESILGLFFGFVIIKVEKLGRVFMVVFSPPPNQKKRVRESLLVGGGFFFFSSFYRSESSLVKTLKQAATISSCSSLSFALFTSCAAIMSAHHIRDTYLRQNLTSAITCGRLAPMPLPVAFLPKGHWL